MSPQEMFSKRVTRSAAASGAVKGARVSKASKPSRSTPRVTDALAQHLLLEAELQRRKKRVSSCKGSLTKARKAVAAREAELAILTAEVEDLTEMVADSAKAVGRVPKGDPLPTPSISAAEDGKTSDPAPPTLVPSPQAAGRKRKQTSGHEEDVQVKRARLASNSPEEEAALALPPVSEAKSSAIASPKSSNAPEGQGSPVTRSEKSPGVREEESQAEAKQSTERDEGHNHGVIDPVGLPNPRNACFANSVLQLLVAALETEAVERLATNGAITSWFGIAAEDRGPLSASWSGSRNKAMVALLMELRCRITEEAESREIAISGYLGQTLQELRAGNAEGSAEAAFILRQALASSGKDGLEAFNGDSQQDAAEFLTFLLAAVMGEDSAIGDPFCHELRQTIGCGECGGTAPARETSTQISLQTTIPLLATGQRHCTVEELLENAMATEKLEGYQCEMCEKAGTSHRTTELARYPEKLLVTIGRTGWIDGRKVMTPVDLPSGAIHVGPESYRLAAVVQHRGRSANGGHYVAYRRHGDSWVELDDKVVTTRDDDTSMQDGGQRTSAILLLEKIPNSG